MTNDNVTCAHLGSNIVSVPEQLISTVLLIKEMSGESPYVIDSTNYINKAVLHKTLVMGFK